MTTYSAEYLEGIKDGRYTLKTEGRENLFALAQSDLQFCDRLEHTAYSGMPETRDYIKGLRDFWNHQLSKAQ